MSAILLSLPHASTTNNWLRRPWPPDSTHAIHGTRKPYKVISFSQNLIASNIKSQKLSSNQPCRPRKHLLSELRRRCWARVTTPGQLLPRCRRCYGSFKRGRPESYYCIIHLLLQNGAGVDTFQLPLTTAQSYQSMQGCPDGLHEVYARASSGRQICDRLRSYSLSFSVQDNLEHLLTFRPRHNTQNSLFSVLRSMASLPNIAARLYVSPCYIAFTMYSAVPERPMLTFSNRKSTGGIQHSIIRAPSQADQESRRLRRHLGLLRPLQLHHRNLQFRLDTVRCDQ
jgi:hypothetical protein